MRGGGAQACGFELSRAQASICSSTQPWGIKHARTLLRMPEPQKWSLEAIRAVAATLWAIREAQKPGVIHHDPSIQSRAGQAA